MAHPLARLNLSLLKVSFKQLIVKFGLMSSPANLTIYSARRGSTRAGNSAIDTRTYESALISLYAATVSENESTNAIPRSSESFCWRACGHSHAGLPRPRTACRCSHFRPDIPGGTSSDTHSAFPIRRGPLVIGTGCCHARPFIFLRDRRIHSEDEVCRKTQVIISVPSIIFVAFSICLFLIT